VFVGLNLCVIGVERGTLDLSESFLFRFFYCSS